MKGGKIMEGLELKAMKGRKSNGTWKWQEKRLNIMPTEWPKKIFEMECRLQIKGRGNGKAQGWH
jgi:hypothetical protein